MERLYSAAMFHDIGKAKIPLAVLDKPGKLDEQERVLIQTHPVAGFEILRGNPGISPEILDQWVDWMVAAGLERDCEFDGWGTQV